MYIFNFICVYVGTYTIHPVYGHARRGVSVAFFLDTFGGKNILFYGVSNTSHKGDKTFMYTNTCHFWNKIEYMNCCRIK